MARRDVGVWLRSVKKRVRVLRGNCGLDSARWVLRWVGCAFGGFVVRGGVARSAGMYGRDGVWACGAETVDAMLQSVAWKIGARVVEKKDAGWSLLGAMMAS